MSGRRGFLALTAAAVAVGTALPTSATTAAHPDAELLAVAERATRAMRLLLDSDSGAVTLTDPQFDVAYDDADDWNRRLIAMRATTIAGMVAKSGVMRLVMELRIPTMLGETVEGCADTHDLIALSLADDLLAGRVGS